MGKGTVKLIANNKKAFHDYFIEDKYEAGISLAGTEVKSLRMGKCSVKESFIRTSIAAQPPSKPVQPLVKTLLSSANILYQQNHSKVKINTGFLP